MRGKTLFFMLFIYKLLPTQLSVSALEAIVLISHFVDPFAEFPIPASVHYLAFFCNFISQNAAKSFPVDQHLDSISLQLQLSGFLFDRQAESRIAA